MAWDSSFESSISNSTAPTQIDDEIIATRTNVRTVVGDEHEFDLAETGRQGEHKEGSAKAYYQTDETEPTTRPGGAPLDGYDAGRINVVTNADLGTKEADVWDGSAWQPLVPGPMTGAICMFGADPNVGHRTTQWLLCNGQAVDSGDYPGLYHHLTGGTDTGNAFVPNLQGQFVRGAPNDGSRDPDPTAASAGDRYNVQDGQVENHDHQVTGTISGDGSHTHTVNENGGHSHDVLARSGTVGSGTITAATGVENGTDETQATSTEETGITIESATHSHTLTGAVAGTTEDSTNVMGGETRPENVALYFYIHV